MGWAESVALCHVGAPWGSGGGRGTPASSLCPSGVGAEDAWEGAEGMTEDDGQDQRLTPHLPSNPTRPACGNHTKRARAAGSGIPKTWLSCTLTPSRASGLQSEKWGCWVVTTSGSKL